MNNTKVKAVRKSELNEMLQTAIKQVTDLGIETRRPIIPRVRNYKATSYFGQCRYRRNEGKYEITISDYHLPDGHSEVMDTLVHEVLHACKNAKGHGEVWKRYASMVNEAYGYNIKRCGDGGLDIPEDKKPKVNYIIECVQCKNKWKRSRMSKLVKHYNHYKCGCGGELKRVK